MRRPILPLLAVLALASCAERGGPVAPERPAPAPTLAELSCTVRVAAGTMSCARPEGGGARENLVVGGQGRYVFLDGTITANAGGVIAVDVTVQNLIPQPLGTADGTTPHPDGVRVFFHVPPSSPTGTVTLANASGTADYTGTGQPYFLYDQVIAPNQTSKAVTWRFNLAGGATDFTFSVFVRAVVPFPQGYVEITPAADSVDAGQSRALAATVRTAVGNPVNGPTVSWASSDTTVATVSAAGVLSAVSHGVATLTATSSDGRVGSRVVHVCAAPGVGQAVALDGAAAGSLCLSGGTTGAQYVAIPANTAGAGDLALSFTGSGITPPGSPAWISEGATTLSPGARPRRDERWEESLRRRERAQAAGWAAAAARAPRASRSGARRAITPGVPTVGMLWSLNTDSESFCSGLDLRTGRVVAVGTHAVIVADTMNPSGGFTAADYADLAARFDTLVHPTVTGAFGSPADVDHNQRVVVFYTRAVNELTPSGSGVYVGGFALSRDHYAPTLCPGSNQGEMFYMMVPDPAGTVNGNPRSLSFVRSVTTATLAHEFQHLVNASRRINVNAASELEEVWLDEGLSHVAEELVFHAAAGTAPRANLGLAQVSDGGTVQSAFLEFQYDNFSRFRDFLVAPEAQGPFQSDDDLGTRGAAWAFLRYAADRRGGSEAALWQTLVNTTLAGRANLRSAFGLSDAQLATWLRDWTAAVYADDAVGGLPAAYAFPSWKTREIYNGVAFTSPPTFAYPLATREPANGVASALSLAPGGAAYLRLRVAANAKAGLTLASGGTTPPATTAMTVIRVK